MVYLTLSYTNPSTLIGHYPNRGGNTLYLFFTIQVSVLLPRNFSGSKVNSLQCHWCCNRPRPRCQIDGARNCSASLLPPIIQDPIRTATTLGLHKYSNYKGETEEFFLIFFNLIFRPFQSILRAIYLILRIFRIITIDRQSLSVDC